MNHSITALAIALALFRTAQAHDHWDNGDPVPAWVKTECCGPKDVHHLRPDQVRRNAAGDYVVDIYPDPIPARRALPSQDGDYWLFFYNRLWLLRQCQVLFRADSVLGPAGLRNSPVVPSGPPDATAPSRINHWSGGSSVGGDSGATL
jgi:hypothetical protein